MTHFSQPKKTKTKSGRPPDDATQGNKCKESEKCKKRERNRKRKRPRKKKSPQKTGNNLSLVHCEKSHLRFLEISNIIELILTGRKYSTWPINRVPLFSHFWE